MCSLFEFWRQKPMWSMFFSMNVFLIINISENFDAKNLQIFERTYSFMIFCTKNVWFVQTKSEKYRK